MVRILGIIVIVVLCGCNDMKNEIVTQRYYLLTLDTRENVTLGYSVNDENSSFVDVVGKTVFAVGYDENYILIKQHPKGNKTIVNYFIVPIYKDFNYSPQEGVIGPLNIEQFKIKRNELGVSETVIFSIVKPELE